MKFPCTKCGACCRHLDKSDLYKELDRGDGVCKYLKGNLCSIYEIRPNLCRVDKCYELYFASHMTRDEFYRTNLAVCRKLRELEE